MVAHTTTYYQVLHENPRGTRTVPGLQPGVQIISPYKGKLGFTHSEYPNKERMTMTVNLIVNHDYYYLIVRVFYHFVIRGIITQIPL